jgi:hypothetical protein
MRVSGRQVTVAGFCGAWRLACFPWIGTVAIREVTAMDVLECLQRLQQQKTPETARRILRYCRQTVRYAVATGRAEFDVLSHLGTILG